jgi:adenylate cyclase
VPPDVPAYTTEDAKALRVATEGLERLDGEQRGRALEFLTREVRTLSNFVARIAETLVDSFEDQEQLGLRESARAEALERGIESSSLGWLLMYGLRRRLDEAVRRRGNVEVGSEPTLAVGFVHLVDFTRSSSGLDAGEFARVLGDFETLAWDEITEAGGRLVKLIGDEAMFVSPSTPRAAEAVLAIVAKCEASDLPRARGALAAGPVLVRGGDHFGAVVNTASRLVDAAAPGAVLVDDAYREIVERSDKLSITRLGSRQLKGIGAATLWGIEPSDDARSELEAPSPRIA